MKNLLFLLFLSACVPVRAPLTEPERIVWVDTYHMAPEDAPVVHWVQGVECPFIPGILAILNYCDSPDTRHCVDHVECDAGEYFELYNIAPVIIFEHIHDSALAHEFLHAYLLFKFGDSDSGHKRPEWSGLMQEANANLVKHGY